MALVLVGAAVYIAITWAVEQMPSSKPYYICDRSRGVMRVPADDATANAIFLRTRPGAVAFVERGDKVAEAPCY